MPTLPVDPSKHDDTDKPKPIVPAGDPDDDDEPDSSPQPITPPVGG